MICPICHKKEATKIVTRKFSGAQVSGQVCDDCLNVALTLDKEGFFYTFISQPDKACRNCGRKLSEIENTLLVGCKMCYREFGIELKPMINRLQGIGTDEN